jgi:hypothetical protein
MQTPILPSDEAELPQKLLKTIRDLTDFGTQPGAISTSLGIPLELVHWVLGNDPKHVLKMIDDIKAKSRMFRCTLSHKLMIHPVKTVSGEVYEKSVLLAHPDFQTISNGYIVPCQKLKAEAIDFSKKSLQVLRCFLHLSSLPGSIFDVTAECLSVLINEDPEIAYQLLESVNQESMQGLIGSLRRLVPEQFFLSLMARLIGEQPSKALYLARVLLLEPIDQKTFDEAFQCFNRLVREANLSSDAVDLAEEICRMLSGSQLEQMKSALKQGNYKDVLDRLRRLEEHNDSFYSSLSESILSLKSLQELEHSPTALQESAVEELKSDATKEPTSQANSLKNSTSKPSRLSFEQNITQVLSRSSTTSLEELLFSLKYPATHKEVAEILETAQTCGSWAALEQAFARLNAESMSDKWRLAGILLRQADLISGDARDAKLHEAVYYLACNGDPQYMSKPAFDKSMDSSFRRYSVESLEISRDAEFSGVLGYLLEDWMAQIKQNALILNKGFAIHLKSMTEIADSLIQLFGLPRLAEELRNAFVLEEKSKRLLIPVIRTYPSMQSLTQSPEIPLGFEELSIHSEECQSEALPSNQPAPSHLLTLANTYQEKLSYFLALIEAKVTEDSSRRDFAEIAAKVQQSTAQSDPVRGMLDLADPNFVQTLERLARQVVTSAVSKIDFEGFALKKSEISNLLELVMHMKAELVNPCCPQDASTDASFREEVYSILAVLWSERVTVHSGLVNATGLNQVQFTIETELSTFDSEQFLNDISQLTAINRRDIDLRSIEAGSVIVNVLIDGGMDNVEKVRRNAQQLPVHSVKIGNFEIKLGSECIDQKYNRIYGPGHTFWRGALQDRWRRGKDPYFCPVGWKRISVKVDGFDQACEGWPVAYHGTCSSNTAGILANGFRASDKGCYMGNKSKAVYFSPCIEYSAHPRYAKPLKIASGEYLQVVLQCRVNPKSIKIRAKETLLEAEAKRTQIHPDYKNARLEWIVFPSKGEDYLVWQRDVVCYGIMVRISLNPRDLPQSTWWKVSRHADINIL